MYFSGVKSSGVNQKDIGAFYGVNRTNKINDYQMSDMKNFDCESFPYLATRRERKLFYDAQEMAVICHDTDIEDDYKVTGVTEDGNFVYRGDYIDCAQELLGNAFVCEYMGDYVMFPKMQVITSRQTAKRSVEKVYSFFPVQNLDSLGMPLSEQFIFIEGDLFSLVGDVIFDGATGKLRFPFNQSYDTIASSLHSAIAKGYISAGKMFSLDFYKGETSLSFPDNVAILIDDVYVYGNYTSYDVGRVGSVEDYFSGGMYSGSVEVDFKVYDLYGNEFDYENYLRENESGFFTFGENVRARFDNDMKMRLGACQSLLCMGASYGGRLFACDMFGVDVFYSATSGVGLKKYDFTPGTSLGDAGSVQCADHGKWTGLIPYGGALYAFKKNGMYRIYSSDGLSFYMDKVCDVGAVSQKAVCVVSDVMYFLSETGLYRFTGTYPEEMPDNLGRRYTDGVLGGYDNKLYASLEYSEGRELVIYDAQVSAFGVHDNFDAVNFVAYGGKLYGLNSADGYVYEMAGERKPCEFSIITRKFFLGFDKKAINGIRLYFDFSGGENEKIEVLVSYDNGEWEQCFKPITSGKLKYVPIKFKKCDELAVKIKGNGIFTLKGMTLSFYSGGDIKQNK